MVAIVGATTGTIQVYRDANGVGGDITWLKSVFLRGIPLFEDDRAIMIPYGNIVGAAQKARGETVMVRLYVGNGEIFTRGYDRTGRLHITIVLGFIRRGTWRAITVLGI